MLETRTISRTFGVRIERIAVARCTDADFEAIWRAFLDHKLVVFPAQTLDEAALVAFARRFGAVQNVEGAAFCSTVSPHVLWLSNIVERGRPIGGFGEPDETPWHIDAMFSPEPIFVGMLFGERIPSVGVDTSFLDLEAVLASLPASLRGRLIGQVGLNSAGGLRGDGVKHPLVRTHPLTGTDALFFSPPHTATIEGAAPDDSEEILRALREAVQTSPAVYAHRWTAGDLVVWDNTRLLHRRGTLPVDAPRLLKRVSCSLPASTRAQPRAPVRATEC